MDHRRADRVSVLCAGHGAYLASHRARNRDSIDQLSPTDQNFEQSIRRQIAVNRERTPTQRMVALCDLLDFARAMAPQDPVARERRRRALEAREQDREQWRAQYRRLFAAQRVNAPSSV